MVKVSIIIPHFNWADLLKKLLDSIPQRTEMEIIVVVDNSTENKMDMLVGKYHNAFFFKNDGIVHSAGKCRNIGIEHALGECLLMPMIILKRGCGKKSNHILIRPCTT